MIKKNYIFDCGSLKLKEYLCILEVQVQKYGD